MGGPKPPALPLGYTPRLYVSDTPHTRDVHGAYITLSTFFFKAQTYFFYQYTLLFLNMYVFF